MYGRVIGLDLPGKKTVSRKGGVEALTMKGMQVVGAMSYRTVVL